MYKQKMESADVTIIGAGVIGLAIAAEIARPGMNIFILEKNPSPGRGISSRNSEVIHGGMYYPQDSFKATLCVEGRRRLYDIAAKNNIPHRKIGKLIVATEPVETEEVEHLHENAQANGVDSTELISSRRIAEMEPNIRACTALYSPETGIISAHDLMNYFLLQARLNKAELINCTEVMGIEKEARNYRIFTRNNNGDTFDFASACVINAAGLESDTIANMVGGNYQLHYCKGDYCSISGVNKSMIKRLIYPVPAKNHVGLGVHLTIDLTGRMKLGPDTTYISRSEDYNVTAQKAPLFYESARKFLPFLQKENVSPDMAGIRPKLQGPNDSFHDFVIREDLPGFINLVGMESPGLTASPAIARLVNKILTGKQSN
ncbi:MAG: FAD-dependent oxidoreductase [Deltaproteobacteria bacterium HGW-Deltaproteobacteria-9]|nr:MAG: FAD-dependent oxidoreductase [Deltaproteobacteria bacterium HGW-Deltaproteobacteria-9]